MTSIFGTPSRDLRVGLVAAGRVDDLMARDRVDRLAGDRGRTCPERAAVRRVGLSPIAGFGTRAWNKRRLFD